MPRLTRTQQQERTRALLIEAAAKRFAERGYDGVGTEDIAETAGFSKGAFYSNFRSKEDIAVAVLHGVAETGQQAFADLIADGPKDEIALLAAVHDILVRLAANIETIQLRADLLLRAARDAKFRPISVAHYARAAAAYEPIIAQLFSRLDREPPAEIRLVVGTFYAALLGSHLLTASGSKIAPLPDVMGLLVNRLFRDAPSTGRKRLARDATAQGRQAQGCVSARVKPRGQSTTSSGPPRRNY